MHLIHISILINRNTFRGKETINAILNKRQLIDRSKFTTQVTAIILAISFLS